MRSSVYHQGRYSANQERCLHHFHGLVSAHMRPHLGAEAAGAGDAGTGHVANGQPR